MKPLMIQNTMINKEMPLPVAKYINNLNILMLRTDIAEEIWKQNPNASEAYGIEGVNCYFIFIYIDGSNEFPYTRITIEYHQ